MATMKQWIAWAEGLVGQAVVGEGLRVGLAGVIQGPLTVTFRLRLLQPTPANLRKLLALGPSLAQSLQVAGVRISDTAQGILVEVPSPRPRTPTALDLARSTQGFTVALGLDQWRKPVKVDLRQNPALLFVGPTRRGKTQAMKATVYALAANNRPPNFGFVVFSQKRQDWQAFEPCVNCWGVIDDPDEAFDVLSWAAADLLQRRAKEGGKTPAVVFVVDDLINLLKRSPNLADPLGELASMGGGCGLFTLIGTQDAGSKRGTGGADVEANITARVVYKAASATIAARAAGAGGLGIEDLSTHKGDAVLILDGRPARIATAYTDDRLVALLPSGDAFNRPWAAPSRSKPRSMDVPRNGSQGLANPIERAGTGQNGKNGAALPPAPTVNGGNVGGGGEEWGEPFLDSTRPPNEEERLRLRRLYAELGSKEKTYFAAWGFKNGKVAAWLTEALEEAQGEEDDDTFGELDLSTPQGRAKLEEWKKSGKVKLGIDVTANA